MNRYPIRCLKFSCFRSKQKAQGEGYGTLQRQLNCSETQRLLQRKNRCFFFLDALFFDQKVKDLIFNNMPRDLIIAFGKKKKTFDV